VSPIPNPNAAAFVNFVSTFDIAKARAEIKLMVRDQDFPLISVDEVELLVRKSKRQDLNRNTPDSHESWIPDHAYSVGDQVVAFPRNNTLYQAVQAGVTGHTQPAWPGLQTNTSVIIVPVPGNLGAQVTDNTVVWQVVDSAAWNPTWNLAYGIRQGWTIKMSKLVGAYDITVGGQVMRRSQFFSQCQEMRRIWGQRASQWDQCFLQGSLRDRRLFQNITNQNDELFIDGQIQWNLLDQYYALRGFTGVSSGGQWVDP
jgi:hypothetical protein